ncbi:MAG: hypothetical protein ACE5LU_08250 [Anaerolineae bacterium]
MRRYIVWVGLLFSSALLGSAQAAEPVAPQQSNTEGWVTQANADRVEALRAQGDTLWAGSTWGGLVGWDVTNDTIVHRLYPQDRLAGNWVKAITIAPDGTLWVATTGGVSRYPPDGPGTNFTIRNTSRRAGVRAMVVERARTDEQEIRLDLANEAEVLSAFSPGYLMFGTDPTIYFYRDWNEPKKAVTISTGLQRTVEPGTPVYAVDVGLAADDVRDLAVDHAGRVWISTFNGVSIYDNGNWTVYTEFNSPLISNDTGAMAIDGAGRVWISHEERGQFTMFDGGWRLYSIDGTIQSLTVNPGDGNVWAATSRLCDPTGTCRGGGVWAFDGVAWHQRYRATDGIADDEVHTIAFGADGRMWLGHEFSSLCSAPVSRWTGSGWQVYESVWEAIEADFGGIMTTQMPTDLWAVAAGRVWTRYRGAVHGYVPDTGWKALYTGSTVLNSNHTRAIASDEAGRVWIGADPAFDGCRHVGGGINYWDGNQWSHYTAENGHLSDNRVDAISVGRDKVWVKTLTGLSRFSNGTWKIYPGTDIAPGVEDDYWSIIDARDMVSINDNRLWAVDDADRVWVWGGNGARYYTPDTGWTNYTFENTLRRKEPAVTFLRQPAPRRETRIWVSAVDIPDSATAQSRFSSGYLMIGDDTTVYRYESFLAHPQEDVNGLQISPELPTRLDPNTPVYAVELGLLSNAVSDVAVGPDSRIWFATRPHRVSSTDVYGGVSVLDVDSETWEHYTVRNTSRRGQVVGRVSAQVEARETRVPADFGSENAANQALSSGFVMFEGDPTLYRYTGYSDTDNALIVYPIFNTLKYPAGVQQALLPDTQIYAVELGLLGTPQGDASAHRLAVDSAGRVWVAVPGVGISVLSSPDQWTNFRRADDGLASVLVSGILARGDEMWVWTDGGGVSVFHNGNPSTGSGHRWRTYDVFNSGLVSDRVEALTITPNGEAWMATHDRGISVLTLPGFRLDTGSRTVLVIPGGTGKVYFEVVPVGGFSGSVALAIEGLPPGVSATPVPASVNGRGSVELTLRVSELVAPGSYPFTVVGRSPDGLSTSRQLTLRVVSSIQYMYLPLVAR